MENKPYTLSFAVDTSSIEMTRLLNKEFLELRIKAISTINPNENMCWFTEDSLERGKKTVYNKPILGYFGNDDFGSHNGILRHDAETNIDYFDVSGAAGERILGLIRENDKVDIEEEDGIYWLVLTCAL